MEQVADELRGLTKRHARPGSNTEHLGIRLLWMEKIPVRPPSFTYATESFTVGKKVKQKSAYWTQLTAC